MTGGGGGVFCQAEGGIRNLVRSRGLGDVYKSQGPEVTVYCWVIKILATTVGETAADLLSTRLGLGPVSYTHLPLPTRDLV